MCPHSKLEHGAMLPSCSRYRNIFLTGQRNVPSSAHSRKYEYYGKRNNITNKKVQKFKTLPS
jgi:hypothetical protein